MELHNLTIHEAHDLLKNKKISSEELTKAFFDRINKVDDKIKAYLTLDEERALKSSREIDNKGIFDKKLSGIPAAIKDNICTKGLKTTCSSKMLENFVPPYDAKVSSKLKSEGAIILGKTNMDEFAMGSRSENSIFEHTKNPWDVKRVPGGSSGGSAAAVAADMCIFALGSDTGGSIREPAGYCGVVGFKPTYGRVSRYGLAAYVSSMDQVGSITKDVYDCAVVMNAIAGHDPMDCSSIDLPVPDYTENLTADVKGLKIGLPKELLNKEIAEDVKVAVLNAAKKFEELGAEVEEISLPYLDYSLWAYYVIAACEGSANMARYDGIRFGHRAEQYDDLVDLYKKSRGEGFGFEVKLRILLGTFLRDDSVVDKYYVKSQKVRTLVKKDCDRIFENYDLMLAPTTPTVAPLQNQNVDDPLKVYLNDMCTVPINLVGLPGISIPCGFSEGLPIGLQIIGKPFDESTVLQAAYTFEQATDFHKQKPVL